MNHDIFVEFAETILKHQIDSLVEKEKNFTSSSNF